MKKRSCLLILFIVTIPLLVQGQQNLIARQISFEFLSKNVSGTIADFQSESSLDLSNPANTSFKGSVGVESLKTGNFLRDWALKGRKYFNEDDFPRIYFKSTEVNESDNGYRVRGTLTLKGTGLPLTINFQRNGNLLEGETELYTSDFGIVIKKKREDNLVKVRLQLEIQ